MESTEKFLISFSKVRLESMDFIENGVQSKVLDFLLKSKSIVFRYYGNLSP